MVKNSATGGKDMYIYISYNYTRSNIIETISHLNLSPPMIVNPLLQRVTKELDLLVLF